MRRNPPMPENIERVISTLEGAFVSLSYFQKAKSICVSNKCRGFKGDICPGAWYAMGYFKTDIWETWGKRGQISCHSGALQMAWDMGFPRIGDLERWARKNPHIWGNGHGGEMFKSAKAWNYSTSMRGLVAHLLRVQKRQKEESQRSAFIRYIRRLFFALKWKIHPDG